MKIEKISKYVLLGLIVLTIVAFGAFFGYGYDNMDPQYGSHNAPILTPMLLVWMYIMIFGTAIAAICAVIKSLITGRGGEGENISGVSGGLVSVISVGILIVSVVVGIVMSLNETEFTAANGTVTSAGMVSVANTFIIAIYLLMIIATLSVIINMTGILKRKA